jgi:Copper type II ascorbate-dependent monooxygenase, C-terminal domain
MLARTARLALLLSSSAALLSACGETPVPSPPSPSFTQGKPPRKSPPTNPVGGFSIELPPKTLMPGDEKTPCYIFPLDVQGSSRFVAGGQITVGPGMHHGNVTTRPKTGEGMRPCPADDPGIPGEAIDILNGGAVLFGSSTQIMGTEWQSFPDGMAYRVKDGYEIVARMHYLNVTQEPLTVAPKYQWYTIAESTVTEELGPFAWTNNDIHIPPKSRSTVAATCQFPQPMHLVNLLPHMHRLGVEFDAAFAGGKLDGQKFLKSPGYDPENGVIEQYDPAIDLSQGDGASFSCTWNNTLDKTIVEGIGDNEMCILFGYAYPPANAYSATAGADHCVYVAPPAP